MRRASRTIDDSARATIPYRDDYTQLRDYRPSPVDPRPPARGWLWLVLLVGLIVVLDVGIAHWLRLSVGP